MAKFFQAWPLFSTIHDLLGNELKSVSWVKIDSYTPDRRSAGVWDRFQWLDAGADSNINGTRCVHFHRHAKVGDRLDSVVCQGS